MASVTDVLGSNTPNEGRVQWNANINAVNAETSANTATLSAVVGSIVGTTQTQTLTNKTMVSSYRGGTNTFSISRRDLESTSLFLVTSDSGSVSNVDVTAASQYSLQILGDNGLDTYVSSNVFYVRNSATCIMNEASQVIGVGVASVTAPNVAEFGGSVKINNRLAVGAEHSAGASVGLHLKENDPEFRIETVASGLAYQTFRDSGGDYFKWTADFTVSGDYLRLDHNGTELLQIGPVDSNVMTIEPDITFNGDSHVMTGDLTVQGILTAEVLNAVSTDILVTSGPITISGAASTWNETVPHNQLAQLITGKILVGNGSNVAEAVWMSGDVGIVAGGATSIANGVVTLAKMSGQNMNTLLGGTTSGVAAKTLHVNSDVSMSFDATTFMITLKDNLIDNANIASGAAIDMNKTALAINISGIVLNGNTLELDSGVKADILYRAVPVGTIIPYGGTISSLASTGFVEPVTGWLFCNGYIIDTGAHPELGGTGGLQETLGSAWGSYGQLPNLMGYFLRGVDPSNSVDPDAERTGGDSVNVGSYQADQVGYHRHELLNDVANNVNPGGSWLPTTGTSGLADLWTKYNQIDGAEAEPTDQTRPRNKGVAYLIKY